MRPHESQVSVQLIRLKTNRCEVWSKSTSTFDTRVTLNSVKVTANFSQSNLELCQGNLELCQGNLELCQSNRNQIKRVQLDTGDHR